MFARIAAFEGGNAEEMYRRNNEMLVERPGELPAGILRVMVLMKDQNRWSVIWFFDSEDAAAAAEARFEQMGDEIPESVRGKRVSLESFEVAFDAGRTRRRHFSQTYTAGLKRASTSQTAGLRARRAATPRAGPAARHRRETHRRRSLPSSESRSSSPRADRPGATAIRTRPRLAHIGPPHPGGRSATTSRPRS